MLPIVESSEILLEMDAHSIASRWRHYDGPPTSVEHVCHGIRCRVQLERVGIPVITIPDAPTECERDILEAIRAAGRRLTQPMLFTALPNHGESTIVKALARMTGDGRLHHIAKRGYGIPNQT